MHRSTLEIKLKFFHFVKLSSHNASLYHPLQRQNTQKQMAHRIIGMADIWTPRDWRSWCKALGPQGSLPKRPLLAGMVQRKAAKRSVRTLPKATVKKLSKNQVLVYPLRPKGNVRDVILLLCVFEIRSCVQDGGIILYRWMPKSDRNYVHSSVENIGVRRM